MRRGLHYLCRLLVCANIPQRTTLSPIHVRRLWKEVQLHAPDTLRVVAHPCHTTNTHILNFVLATIYEGILGPDPA